MADEEDDYFHKLPIGSLACTKEQKKMIEDSRREYRDATLANDLFGGIAASELPQAMAYGGEEWVGPNISELVTNELSRT